MRFIQLTQLAKLYLPLAHQVLPPQALLTLALLVAQMGNLYLCKLDAMTILCPPSWLMLSQHLQQVAV
jgi:hypothetical protein